MFKIILLCLLTCCSSFMPLKHSESNISEVHIQVVENKVRKNTYIEERYQVLYSFSALTSDSYWTNMVNYLQTSDLIFLGGHLYGTTDTPVSNYSIWNGSSVWQADSSSLSSCHVYTIDLSSPTGYSVVPSVSFTDILFAVRDDTNVSGAKILDFSMVLSFSNNNYTLSFLAYFEPTNNYISSIVAMGTFSQIFSGYKQLLAFPKGNFGPSQISNTMSDGYDEGYAAGFNFGYDAGAHEVQANYDNEVYEQGYTAGYSSGLSEGLSSGSEVMTIFAGIMDVAFIPVNVFFLMFNYEVFGINIAGFVSGLLTLAIVIILMRFIFGRKV